MAIVIREVSDADITQTCNIEHAAYNPNGPMPSTLFPGPFPPNSREMRVEQIISMRKNDPTAQYLKAVDDETGEQIAFAKWHTYTTPEAVASAPMRPIPSAPGVNVEACKAFFGGLVTKKKEIMGIKPHLYLHMLHTDPKHQRRGAGGVLVKWGTKKADDLRLPIYLESSAEGYRLYQKHGFEKVESFEVDLTQFGGDNTASAALMIREPLL